MGLALCVGDPHVFVRADMRYAQYDWFEAPERSCEHVRDWWDSHWHGRDGFGRDLSAEPLWRAIRDHVPQGGLFLEAGCGTGRWVAFLSDRGIRTVGVDYAFSGLQVGRSVDPSLWLLQADCRSLPFGNNTFDVVLSFGTVEHDVQGPQSLLLEFYRILKPNGVLFCSVPCLNIARCMLLPWFWLRDSLKCSPFVCRLAGKKERFGFYQYLFTPAEYRRLLASAGFDVLDVRGYGAMRHGSLGRGVAKLFGRMFRFYDAHMMMAICRRRPRQTPVRAVAD